MPSSAPQHQATNHHQYHPSHHHHHQTAHQHGGPPARPSSARDNETNQGNRQQQQQQNAVSARPPDSTTRPTSTRRESSSSSSGMPDRVGSYAIREEIGRGSFAVVYRGDKVTVNPPVPVAIKAVIRSKLTTKLLENLESEIRLLKNIKQRNVVELLDCLKTEQHIYLVMAYCSAGDLSQYIRKKGQVSGLNPLPMVNGIIRDKFPHPKEGGLNETIVRCFLGQLAEALKFLRDQNIIHRDIKPQNLLLHPPSPADIKAGHPDLSIPLLRVADFGFARALPQQSLAETLCGSPLYMAPEILRYEKYDAKADLWSVGAVTFEMCVGKPPFRAQNHVELLRRIERGEDRITFPDEKVSSKEASNDDKRRAIASDGKQISTVTVVAPDIKELIRRLLKRNPVERMSFSEFFKMTDELVNKWGEESLCAPGSMEMSRPPHPVPTRQTSSGTATPAKAGVAISRNSSSPGQRRLEPLSRVSTTAEPSQASRGQQPVTSSRPASKVPSRNPSHANLGALASERPQPEPIVSDEPLPSPLVLPSSDAEQEPAFTPLSRQSRTQSASASATQPPAVQPPPSSSRNSPMPRASGDSSSTSPILNENESRPSSSAQRRQPFAPKYVVGGGNGLNTSKGEVRPKDFATINANVIPPTPATSDPPMPTERTAGLAAATNASSQPPQQSNLSLAIPPTSHIARQRVMSQDSMQASGTTNTSDSDSILGKEYVVVEKRNVEVNALADELAAQSKRNAHHTISRRDSRGFLQRQLSGLNAQSPPLANNKQINPSPPSPAQPYPPVPPDVGDQPAFATNLTRPPLQTYSSSPRNRGSFGQSNAMTYGNVGYGSSPARSDGMGYTGTNAVSTSAPTVTSPLAIVGNPSAAIAKALNMASLKLFGSPTENIWLRKKAYRRPVERYSNQELQDPHEEKLLTNLEDIALKATVIFDFADSKFFLMTTSAAHGHSSQTTPGGSRTASVAHTPGGSSTPVHGGQPTTQMNASQASPFFSSVHQPPLSPQQQYGTVRTAARRDSSTSSNSDRPTVTSPQIHQPSSGSSDARKLELLPAEALVLYLKALAFLQKGIEMARAFWSAKPAGQVASNDFNDYVQWFRSRFNECFEKADFAKGRLTGGIPDSAMLAEKLIFDRALEMSRAAAVSELMGENPGECEIAYDTALWMLYAILDDTMQEEEIVEEEDKATVQNFVKSIQGRLDALRRKMRSATA